SRRFNIDYRGWLPTELCKSKVQHFYDTVASAEHDVLGLDIAMHDARFMRGAKSVSGLDRDVQRLVELQPPICQALAQRFPIDEFGGDEAAAVSFSNLVNGENVRMIQ